MAFHPLDGLRASHYGLFWNQIREEFPETEDQPPLIRPEEAFSMAIQPRYPLPRCWYVHRDRNLLIQLQGNRIWLNWRRLGSSSQYPRFPALLDIFQRISSQLAEFFRVANVGLLMPVSFDLTYVNHIPLGAICPSYDRVGNFMRDVAWRRRDSKLPVPEGIAWTGTFAVEGIRLAAELKTGKEQVGELRPLYVLELRATSPNLLVAERLADSNFEWYTHAHGILLDAFDDLTTPEARHEHWLGTDNTN
jgi:hypothetical protein